MMASITEVDLIAFYFLLVFAAVPVAVRVLSLVERLDATRQRLREEAARRRAHPLAISFGR